MKAVNIIEELTKFPYNESDGIIRVDNDVVILNAFRQTFGNNLSTVYAPHTLLNTGGKEGRNFLYIYTDRFPYSDEDIFAILQADDNLIYIYEIE